MKDREEYISILEQDNAELKKQLEDMTLCRDIASGHREEVQDRETKLLTQQKEFIKYLEDEIQKKSEKSITLTSFTRNVVPLQQCLQKYKETIGDK